MCGRVDTIGLRAATLAVGCKFTQFTDAGSKSSASAIG